jgi:hypothetical protein
MTVGSLDTDQEKSMRALVRKTAQLGEVVAAVFDKAAHYSADPKGVSRLATRAVALILHRQWRPLPHPRWPSFFAGDLL